MGSEVSRWWSQRVSDGTLHGEFACGYISCLHAQEMVDQTQMTLSQRWGSRDVLGHSTKTKRQQGENFFFLRVCHLVRSVIGDVISVEKTVKRCLLDTFKHTDEEFLKQASSQ